MPMQVIVLSCRIQYTPYMFEKDWDSFRRGKKSTQSKRNNVTMFLAKKSYQNGRVNEKILRFRKGPVFWHGVVRGANDAGAVHDNHLGGRGVSAGSWLLRQSMAILNGKMKDHGFLRVFGVPVISHIVCWKSPSNLHGFRDFPSPTWLMTSVGWLAAHLGAWLQAYFLNENWSGDKMEVQSCGYHPSETSDWDLLGLRWFPDFW